LKVLAIGAAGTSAGLVVKALSAAGVSVRGLVHSAGKEGTARDNGAAETVVADLADGEALRLAMAGIDGVFHVIPAFVRDEPGIGVGVVEAAQDAGVGRVVFSSVYHPSLTALSNHRDKQPAEQALFTSSMEFTILQPAMFMNQLDGLVAAALEKGVISGPYSSESRMSYVDYREVAEVAALSFTTDRFVNGTFELAAQGEPSRADLATELSKILGRPIRAESFTPDLRNSRMPQSLQDGLMKMFDSYDKHGFHGGNSLVLATMLGREPITAAGYLAEVAQAR